MRNDSDERGAKLMTGSPDWKDYSFNADVELLGSPGDAGLILRSSDEEQGVDSYRGYYVGSTQQRRKSDYWVCRSWLDRVSRGTDAGWRTCSSLVSPDGCPSTAARSPHTPTKFRTELQQTVSYTDRNCLTSGRIGLRSHSSGGAWKNLAVLPLTGALTISHQVEPYHAPRDLPYAVDDPVMQSRTRPEDPGAASAADQAAGRAAEAGCGIRG